MVTADRQPKPAFAAVKEMFTSEPAPDARFAPSVGVAATALLAAGLWVWARQSGRPAPSREEETGPGAAPELAPAGRRDGVRPAMPRARPPASYGPEGG
jgi:hypothetical protein